MRPNIQISHALNGRVKDYAAEHDLSTAEAYERIIRTGLDQLQRVDDDTADEADGEIDAVLDGVYRGMDDPEQRFAIGQHALNWLRSRGEPKSKSEFQAALFEERHRDGESEETWYRKNVQTALSTARDAGLVNWREGHKDWEWVGE